MRLTCRQRACKKLRNILTDWRVPFEGKWQDNSEGQAHARVQNFASNMPAAVVDAGAVPVPVVLPVPVVVEP